MSKSNSTPFDEQHAEAESYDALIDNLNSVSIKKYYNAYLDIPWDAPEFQILRNDHRWILSDSDPIGGTNWYQALPKDVQANLALDRTVFRVKLGVIFENILIRGMMAFSATLPNRSKEFRYVLHECIEETQHSLMFQEFINRSGVEPEGITFPVRLLARYMLFCAKSFPELFFLFVLAGEEPIDLEQRKQLSEQKDLHPLMKLINKIHITEEARHICFASNYLRQSIPKLSTWRKLKLKLLAPLILNIMGKLATSSSSTLAKKYRMPSDVIKLIDANAKKRQDLKVVMKPIVDLCEEVKLVNRNNLFLWRYLSLID